MFTYNSLLKSWNQNGSISAISKHSEPIRKMFCISFDEKRLNINPNEYESIPTKSIWDPNLSELGLIQTGFLNWINPNEFEVRMIRIGSDSFRLMSQIKSDWFLTIFHKTRYKTFFGLVQNGSITDCGMARNSSDSLGMNFNPLLSPVSLFNSAILFILLPPDYSTTTSQSKYYITGINRQFNCDCIVVILQTTGKLVCKLGKFAWLSTVIHEKVRNCGVGRRRKRSVEEDNLWSEKTSGRTMRSIVYTRIAPVRAHSDAVFQPEPYAQYLRRHIAKRGRRSKTICRAIYPTAKKNPYTYTSSCDRNTVSVDITLGGLPYLFL